MGSPLWRHTTRISQVSRGVSYYWKCTFCPSNKGKPFNSSYSWVKLHFMGPVGKGFGRCEGKNGTRMTSVEIVSFVREQEAVDAFVKRSKKSYYQAPSSKSKMHSPTKPIVSSQHPFLQVPILEEDELEVGISTSKRGTLHTAFKMKARDHAHEAIARCLYANGLPFNLVRSPYWKEMVAAIKESPADYTSPGYEKVVETHFASHTTIMGPLLKVKDSLKQMVITNQWGIWKASNSERAQRVRDLALDESWWARVAYVLDFTKPIMTMLYFSTTNTPCLGDVYDGMETMVEKVKHSIQAHVSDPTQSKALCNQVEAIIHHCCEKMTTPLHLLAYALFPRYYNEDVLGMSGRVTSFADEEVAEGCHKAFTRFFPQEEMHEKVRLEFRLIASRLKHSPFAIKDEKQMGAITWWYVYGQPFKHLQSLAIKVLPQVACFSTAERKWNTHSFIHLVKRNQLGSKKAEDLVFVHTNLRLLSHKNEHYKRQQSFGM